MAPVPFALVCFRANPGGGKSRAAGKQVDILNETIMHAVNAGGKAFLSHTKLNDELVLRLSIGNIRTSEEHVQRVWELLNQQLRQQHS
jgi:aromatic-L-amino-acid decarboxylase